MGFERENDNGLAGYRLDSLLERLEQAVSALEGGNQAAGPDVVLSTLSRLERRDQQSFNAMEMFATALKSVSSHLSHLRNAAHVANTQTAGQLETLLARLDGLEQRAAPDLSALGPALEAVLDRLGGLEEKLDQTAQRGQAWPFDSETFADALAAIADRLERVEAKVDRAAQQPALEPEATASLLASIAERLSRVEGKVDSGADGTSIAACLMAVDHRLSGIENRLGMGRPMPQETPAPAEAPSPAKTGSLSPPPLPVIEGKPRERVDQLLEQVFRVLSR